MGLKFVDLPDAAAVGPGEGLKIEVVAPVEPKLAPGSVMEVGELVDGFRYVPPRPSERAPLYDVAWNEDEDFAPYEPPSRPVGVRRYESAPAEALAPPQPPRRERDGRWFGFDNPLPDFGAERRARRARLDALEDQRRGELQQRRDAYEARRYEDRRDDRRSEAPPRVDEATDGPYGPEVG